MIVRVSGNLRGKFLHQKTGIARTAVRASTTGHLLEGKEMKFRFIEERKRTHSVKKMAEILEVSRSGYYEWHVRARCERICADERLVETIKAIQASSDYTYGIVRGSQRHFIGVDIRLATTAWRACCGKTGLA